MALSLTHRQTRNKLYGEWLQANNVLPDTSEWARRQRRAELSIKDVKRRFQEGDGVYAPDIAGRLTVCGCAISRIENTIEYTLSDGSDYLRNADGSFRWFDERELMTDRPKRQRLWIRWSRVRHWIAGLLSFLTSDWRRQIDNYLSIGPGYLLWCLSRAAARQPELLTKPQANPLPEAA